MLTSINNIIEIKKRDTKTVALISLFNTLYKFVQNCIYNLYIKSIFINVVQIIYYRKLLVKYFSSQIRITFLLIINICLYYNIKYVLMKGINNGKNKTLQF